MGLWFWRENLNLLFRDLLVFLDGPLLLVVEVPTPVSDGGLLLVAEDGVDGHEVGAAGVGALGGEELGKVGNGLVGLVIESLAETLHVLLGVVDAADEGKLVETSVEESVVVVVGHDVAEDKETGDQESADDEESDQTTHDTTEVVVLLSISDVVVIVVGDGGGVTGGLVVGLVSS